MGGSHASFGILAQVIRVYNGSDDQVAAMGQR
jgi:hypothetical protein